MQSMTSPQPMQEKIYLLWFSYVYILTDY